MTWGWVIHNKIFIFKKEEKKGDQFYPIPYSQILSNLHITNPNLSLDTSWASTFLSLSLSDLGIRTGGGFGSTGCCGTSIDVKYAITCLPSCLIPAGALQLRVPSVCSHTNTHRHITRRASRTKHVSPHAWKCNTHLYRNGKQNTHLL